MSNHAFSVAVFPFLKTSGAIQIGAYTFRSTTDVEGLPSEQANSVNEIAQMLFVQGDLRVKSASYAITPWLDVDRSCAAIDQLSQLRTVLTYIYASPHEISESIFLRPEEVSLVLFMPSLVSVFLTRPEYHTENICAMAGPKPNEQHEVVGYRGFYNFRHHFWIEPASRLYGPKPHITLNISQDLRTDIGHRSQFRTDYHLLLRLLQKPLTPAALRIYSALSWFNAANEHGLDPDRALLNLAVAFEALLRLPDSSKTERLVDAIALLLGRTERLDDWARQFYDARSRVAHEGRAGDRYFYSPGRNKHPSALFGSLMLYGRQIFQLCMSALLVGVDLAENADLQEKFVTNNERFEKICNLLRAEACLPGERLLGISSTLRALERYRFIPSREISRVTLITAVTYAAETLIECKLPLPQNLADALTRCSISTRGDDELTRLGVVENLTNAFESIDLTCFAPEARIVRDLAEIAWMSLFERYYLLNQSR